MPKMSTLTRNPKSGSWIARKQIPASLRSHYAASFGKGWEEKFARPAGLSEREARLAHAEWLAGVEARLNLIETELRGDGVDLGHVQAHALAGRWYRWKTERHSSEPGAVKRWADEINGLIANIAALVPASAGNGAPPVLTSIPGAPTRQRFADLVEKLTFSQAKVLDRVASAAEAPEFLARERLALTPEARKRFLCALLYELVAANALLVRRAEGDYAPDPRPQRFPEWKPPTTNAALSTFNLYKAWAEANEKRTSASTRNRWISVFRHLESFWDGKDVAAFTEEDAVTWRETLREGGRSDKTINFQYIAAAKAVFGWAARPKTNDGGAILALNPFANFRMSAKSGSRKTAKLRERSFRLEEMALVLPAASQVSLALRGRPFEKAKRWVPWLLAYTGARPGEICQLRREDLRKVQGRWALRLTPEAGTIKDREARIVPIHDDLIEQGLVGFIEAQEDGPLFYAREKLRRVVQDDPTNPRRFPHEKVATRLAGWVRELGVADPNLKPNHAWRHTFKTRALVAGIDSVVADFICGHATKSVGDTYYALEGDAGWPALTRAIDAFPRYRLED